MKNGFNYISIEEYIKSYININPKENSKELRKRFQEVIEDRKKGIKCYCGNEIWIVGSAIVGNSCFTCITGEAYPDDDYEIICS